MAERWLPSDAAFASPRTETGTTATSGLGVLPLHAEMRTQRARADGEDHVVDGRTEARLEHPHFFHVQLGEGHRPVGAHRCLERVGRAQRDRHRTESLVRRATGQPYGRAAHFARGAQPPQRAADEGRQRVGHQLGLRGQPGRQPWRAGLGHRAAFRGQVEKLGQHLGAGDAVDDGVVDLGDEPDHAFGHALDDVHLPRRLLRGERTPHHLGHHGPEFGVAPRCRDCDSVEMVGQVEVGIVDPTWMIQSERDGHEPTPERLQGRYAGLQDAGDALEAVAARQRRGIEDADVGNLHRRLRGVGVDEHWIDAGHPLHVYFSTW